MLINAKTFDKIVNSATGIQLFFFSNQIRLIHKDDLLVKQNLSQQEGVAKQSKYSKSIYY